jgi:hypothetical protein
VLSLLNYSGQPDNNQGKKGGNSYRRAAALSIWPDAGRANVSDALAAGQGEVEKGASAPGYEKPAALLDWEIPHSTTDQKGFGQGR